MSHLYIQVCFQDPIKSLRWSLFARAFYTPLKSFGSNNSVKFVSRKKVNDLKGVILTFERLMLTWNRDLIPCFNYIKSYFILSHRIGLLFLISYPLFSMITVSFDSWNARLLKMIRLVPFRSRNRSFSTILKIIRNFFDHKVYSLTSKLITISSALF